MTNLYAERDIIEQGDYYSRHTSAMTGEDLHRKSDIAAELAHRDIEIDRLKAENEALQARVAELESILGAAWSSHCLESVEWTDKAKDVLSRSESAPWILRKQAEAVEEQAREWSPEDQTYSGRKPHKELIAAAQRLRTQADELEAHD